MELNEQQRAWAQAQLGGPIRESKSGQIGTARSFRLGTNGNGVWFFVNSLEREVYKQFPKHLRVTSVPDPQVIQSGMEGIEMTTQEQVVENKGVRPDPVVVAYLPQADQDPEVGGPCDPYSWVMGVIVAGLDYAFGDEALEMLGVTETEQLAKIAMVIDPKERPDWNLSHIMDWAEDRKASV